MASSLPEAKLARLPRRRLEALGFLECLEGGLAGALGESCLAEEQGCLPRPAIAREALGEALEHAAGEWVQTVVEGLLTDQEETVGFLEGKGGARPGAEDDESREQRENQRRAQVRHTDMVRLPRPLR